MLFAVHLPKTVSLANGKLHALFLVCSLGVFGFCIWNFFNSKGGTIELPNAPMVSIKFDMMSLKRALNYNASNDRLCTKPHEWRSRHIDPQEFPPIMRTYERFGCSWLTADACNLDSNCMDLFETGSTSSPFALNMFIKNQYMYLGSSVILPGLNHSLGKFDVAVDTRFTPFTQGYTYNFTYTFALQKPPPRFFGLNQNLPDMGSERNAKTVLLDHAGMPAVIFQPGEDVTVSVPQALQLAQGIRDVEPMFISQRYWLGDFTGNEKHFPSWIFENGCLLHAVANCYSNDHDLKKTAGERASDTSDAAAWEMGASEKVPVCLLQLSIAATAAMDMGVDVKDFGRTVRKITALVRIEGKAGSSYFRAYDSNSILLFLTSALVLLGLPKKFINWFALNCIGQLSSIYKRVVVQDFGVSYACARAVLQVISQSVCFNDLADSHGPDGHVKGSISLGRVQERFKGVVRHRGECLDEKEVEVLSDFAYSEALRAARRSRMNVRGFGISRQGTKGDDVEGSLDIDGFCYITSSQALSLDSLVKLFDADRRVCFGERLFTPSDLWKQVHSCQRHSEGDQAPVLTNSTTTESHHAMPKMSLGRSLSRLETAVSFGQTQSEMQTFSQVADEGLPSWALSVDPRVSRSCGLPATVKSGPLLDLDEHAEGAHMTAVQLHQLKASIEDISNRVESLKVEVQHERELRRACEQALRDELLGTMKKNSEQMSLHMALAAGNSPQGTFRSDNRNANQQTVNQQTPVSQDLAQLRQEVLGAVAEAEIRMKRVAHHAAEKQIKLLRPALNELDGQIEQMVRRETVRQIKCLWPALEQQLQKHALTAKMTPPPTVSLREPSPSDMDFMPDDKPQSDQASQADQASRLLQVTSKFEAVGHEVDTAALNPMLVSRSRRPQSLAHSPQQERPRQEAFMPS